MKKYNGSCHCGNVRFEARMDLKDALTCNCSHCHKKGFVLTFIPESQFVLLSGKDNLTTYQFNKKIIDHLFCVQSFGKGKGHDGSPTVAINLRCLDDVDISKLNTKEYNGKDM